MKTKIVLFGLLVGCVFASCKKDTEVAVTPSNSSLDNTTTVESMPKSPKRGVSFNIRTLQDGVALADFISWHYNWANEATNAPLGWLESYNIDFCPMCWSRNYRAYAIRNFVAAHPNTKYLLGYNEPNLTDQANMIPDSAAKDWPNVVALAKELNLKLGAPAMNYGTLPGYADPIKWLDEFFSKPGCSLNDIDFIPIHCYMQTPSAVKGYVEKFYKYNKPIWMTEFCAWENISSFEAQKEYMSEVLNYFETNPQVERYAWFIPRSASATNAKPYNQLLVKGSSELTDLGRVYAGMSSQNKSVCISSANPIRANWYSETNTTNILVKNSTDDASKLMIYNLDNNKWVQYQVDVVNASTTMDLRYYSTLSTAINVYVDGTVAQSVILPATGDAWNTYTFSDFKIDGKALKGKHSFRFETLNGYINFAYFQFR